MQYEKCSIKFNLVYLPEKTKLAELLSILRGFPEQKRFGNTSDVSIHLQYFQPLFSITVQISRREKKILSRYHKRNLMFIVRNEYLKKGGGGEKIKNKTQTF